VIHGRKFDVMDAWSVNPIERNGSQQRDRLNDGRQTRGAAVNNLARRARNIAAWTRRRLSGAAFNSQAVRSTDRSAMPVNHGDPQQMQLEEHQKVCRMDQPISSEQFANHRLP
jgi:hypothetical protein